MLSRRSFLRSGTLTALAAGFAAGTGRLTFGQRLKKSTPALDFPIPNRARQEPLFYYTRTAFENAVGSTFQTPDARGRMINLTLVSVTAYKTGATTKITTKAPRATDAFRLSFKASAKLPGLTSIYILRHPVLGKFDLFMTLQRNDSTGIFYDAVVNHAL